MNCPPLPPDPDDRDPDPDEYDPDNEESACLMFISNRFYDA